MNFQYPILEAEQDHHEFRVVVDMRYAPMPRVGQTLADRTGRTFKVKGVPLHGYMGDRCTVVIRPSDWLRGPTGSVLETALNPS